MEPPKIISDQDNKNSMECGDSPNWSLVLNRAKPENWAKVYTADAKGTVILMTCFCWLQARQNWARFFSKLTTSLVNVSLKFQMLISEICQYFLVKKCEKLLIFSPKNISVHVFGYKVAKHLTS